MRCWNRAWAALIAVCLLLQGCANTGGDSGKTTASGIGAVVGGLLGLAAADALAKSEGKRLKLSPQQIEQRKRGYMIAFALVGAAGGSALAGTVYGKLKEQGRKEREAALQAAAAQAKPQRYGEPTEPGLKGSVTPTKRYAEAQRECVDLEDTLADGSARDSIFVKMCRSLPNGGWQQVTA